MGLGRTEAGATGEAESLHRVVPVGEEYKVDALKE